MLYRAAARSFKRFATYMLEFILSEGINYVGNVLFSVETGRMELHCSRFHMAKQSSAIQWFRLPLMQYVTGLFIYVTFS